MKKERKNDSTEFIFKQGRGGGDHKTSAGILGSLHGFKESQFPNLPGQEPQNRESQLCILLHKQHFYKELSIPVMRG